jgi:hypothetical protein
MFRIPSFSARKPSRRRFLRLETIEDRLVPAPIVGVSVGGTSTDQYPPVGNSGAVGPNHFAQFTIGKFTVFNKSGVQQLQKTDAAFWLDAGILSTIVDDGLAQPRIMYDALSDRWFAIEMTLAATSNQILLARSNTADPTGIWQAVNYTATTQFGNFPTLGVDATGVYIGTGNFTTSAASASPTGSTMTSIPKVDLVDVAPSVARKTTVTDASSPIDMGWSPQAVTNFAASPAAASVIATHYSDFDKIVYWEITGSGDANATFGSPVNRTIPHNALPGPSRQPDGTRDMSGGDDDRYTGAVYQVGDLIYIAHAISVNGTGVGSDYHPLFNPSTTNGIQLIVMRDSTNQVVATANYFNTSYDYTFPSVAANEFGDIVIGLNRSGGSSSTNGNIGAYAVHARIDPANPTSITFLGEVTIKAGEANDYNLTGTNIETWGPYSATSRDPNNPFEFWTTQEYVKLIDGGSAWGTQVSQLYISPRLTSITTSAADGTYGLGASIDFTITFNGDVEVTGSPFLALNSGGSATYLSGSGTNELIFRYTVGAGEQSSDLDYTSASAINLNGGSIDLAGASVAVPAELTLPAPGMAGSIAFSHDIVVNAVVPAVTSVTSSTADGTYGFGSLVTIQIEFSRDALVTGTPQLALNSGGVANYASGSGSTILVFNYTVGAGHGSLDLDYSSADALTLNGGTITDEINGGPAALTLPDPGMAGSLGFNKNIVIDALPPIVTGVNSPDADGSYGFGAVIAVDITFDKDVLVTSNPQLALNSGGTAIYASGSGTNVLRFNYTVGAGQSTGDLDYSSSSALTLNGGTIVEESTGQNANLDLPNPGSAGSLGFNKNIVIDTTQALVTNVTSPMANGIYIVNSTIDITIQFDKVVFVTGTPTLALNSGGTATYFGGSGSDTLTFQYLVAAGHASADLDYTSSSALALNGGTIKENGGQDANLTLPPPGATNSLGANKDIVVDATVPTVVEFRALFGRKNFNLIGSTRNVLPWRITALQAVFSEPITTGNRFSLSGLSAYSFTGKNTNTLTWKFIPKTKGSFNAMLADAGANALKDAAGNPIASFSQAFQVLYGDFDDNGVVNKNDELGIRAFVAAPYQLNPSGYNIFADLSGDGIVNLIDVGIARARKGQSLV